MNDALPPLMLELAEVIGFDATWTLVRAKGGQRVFIPSSVDAGHWLCQLVGLEAGQKLAEHLRGGRSGCELTIPLARTYQSRRALAEALGEGASANEAAAAAGVHIRTAYRHRKRLKNTNQLKLFD